MDAFPDVQWRATSLTSGQTFAGSITKSHSDRLMVLPHDGDIRRSEVQNVIVSKCDCRVDLVTSDGGTHVVDHERIEDETLALVRGEVNVALRVLRYGGTFVLKIFESCTAESLFVLGRLCGSFGSVAILKPTWSRPTNSELYVICTGFQKDAGEHIPTGNWVYDTHSILEEMCELQTSALLHALDQAQKATDSVRANSGPHGKRKRFTDRSMRQPASSGRAVLR